MQPNNERWDDYNRWENMIKPATFFEEKSNVFKIRSLLVPKYAREAVANKTHPWNTEVTTKKGPRNTSMELLQKRHEKRQNALKSRNVQ